MPRASFILACVPPCRASNDQGCGSSKRAIFKVAALSSSTLVSKFPSERILIPLNPILSVNSATCTYIVNVVDAE